MIRLADRDIERLIAQAAATYGVLPPAWDGVHPRVLRAALILAEGNERRVTLDEDGSLTVHNRPVW